MSDKQYKMLRKQLRNVTQELFPDVLKNELVANVHRDLTSKVDARLDSITTMVKTTLDQLDKRSKDMQSYVVRNVGLPTAPVSSPDVQAQGDPNAIQPESERNRS